MVAEPGGIANARDVVLTTPRLRLTTWFRTDVDELTELHSDPVVMAHMITGTQNWEQTRARVQGWIAEQMTKGWSKWRVSDHDDNLLGRAGFGTSHRTGDREVGYLLRREAWGHGLATELAEALVSWHQQHPDPTVSDRLRGYAHETNLASRRVLEKAGFRRAGRDPRSASQLLFIRDATPEQAHLPVTTQVAAETPGHALRTRVAATPPDEDRRGDA